jgi:hypothetical protein
MPELQGTLPTPSSSLNEPLSDILGDKNEVSFDSDNSSGFEDEDERSQYVHGEPVIQTGRDVSRYLVDLGDDQDPHFTLRSVLLGTVVGGLGATLYEVGLVQSLIPIFGPLVCRSLSLNL